MQQKIQIQMQKKILYYGYRNFLFIFYFLSQTIVCNRFNSLKSDCLKYICGHFDHLIVASGYII